jgi:hypothetical protein
VCINMIHITPWAACKGLVSGAERTLRSGIAEVTKLAHRHGFSLAETIPMPPII